MKTTTEPTRSNLTILIAKGMITSLLILTATTQLGRAQGQLGSGTIVGSGSGPYTYDLTFSDAGGATNSIGSVWYAWVPGGFFLPSAPTTVSAPAGWTATIANGVTGSSIQFVASLAANNIAAGSSLSGFSYTATFSPAQLAAAANSGESVAYHAGLFSDAGNTFTVQAVPEPSAALLLLASGLVWASGRRALRHTLCSTVKLVALPGTLNSRRAHKHV